MDCVEGTGYGAGKEGGVESKEWVESRVHGCVLREKARKSHYYFVSDF